jgi:hypothetical protein
MEHYCINGKLYLPPITQKNMENSIVIKTAFSNITLTENDIINLLEEKKLIDSILLMLINNDEKWENNQEVEFNRDEAKKFLEYYFDKTDYSKNYIKTTLNKIN